MKKLIPLFLALVINANAYAEVACTGAGEYQSCEDVATSDPTQCSGDTNPVIEHTGVDKEPFVCDNQSLVGSGKSDDEVDEAVKEYTKQCKKKAKAYKKALMKNLMSKGKVGQWVQALFKRKKYDADVKNGKRVNQDIKLDPSMLQGKSEQEIEDYILSELEKTSGIKDLKAKAKIAQEKPEFKGGFHQAENVPLNVMVQTKKKNSCKIEVDKLPALTDAPVKQCEFCVEKNITGSFTNDCSYMVNKNLSEDDAKKIVGATKTTDYCNHNMDGVENDMSEVDKMSKQLCDIAKSGLKPQFKIETSRNLYNDKTVDLAKKRGEFIQKSVRASLMDPKKCDLGEDVPEWLSDEKEYAKAVEVTHPYYEKGKTGNYGPSPYTTGEADQGEEVKNLAATLAKEKEELQGKEKLALAEKADHEKEIVEIKKQIELLKKDFEKVRSALSSAKQIDPSLFDMKDQLGSISNLIQDKHSRIDQLRQKASDASVQGAGFTARLKTVDATNTKKVTLLKEFYAEKNGTKTPARSTAEWDDLLFGDFKMVRISGKAVEDSIIPGVDPKHITPAVNIALNAMVDVDNFTCVVEPLETHKVTIGGVLKFPLKVAMILTTPVVAVVGGATALAVSPLTTGASFLCSGCGDPGNTPPILRFGNWRHLDLSKSSRRGAWQDTKAAFHAYTSWGGLLDVDKRKTSHEWSTEEVWKMEQERLSKKDQ